MKRTTKLILVFIFSLFLSLLSGCGFMVIEVTPTPMPQIPTETPLLVNTLTSAPSTPKPDMALSADGPWLVYFHKHTVVADSETIQVEFIIMNQDGSEKRMIYPSYCNVADFLMNGEGAANYMYEPDEKGIYLFRPEQASGSLVYFTNYSQNCGNTFSRREKGGLLADIYYPEEDAIPELIVYELPAGTIRARQPLIQCPEEEKGCLDNGSGLFADIARQELRWSEDGRYLVFAAVQNSISSDLYILDSQDGSVRQLTSGPDWVGAVWWSPDGSQLLMEEIVIPWKDEQDRKDRFYSSGVIPSSLWSVSVSDDQIRFLYSIENSQQDGPSRWLDSKRFLIYEGSLIQMFEMPNNLRLVDTSSGEARLLFDGRFMDFDLDEIHEIIAVSMEFPEEGYEEGIYLVSMKNSTFRYLDTPQYGFSGYWDEKTGLFVSDSTCKDDPEKLHAFNYLGEFSCVSKPSWPVLPTAYPAPDGKSEVSVEGGLWLKAAGQDVIQVSQETASNVIWCPDSSCFFFFVKQEDSTSHLYHVSLPELTVNLVDEGIRYPNEYTAQWLQKNDSQP